MSEGIVRRGPPGDLAGRLNGWRRRHSLQIAAVLVFTVTCFLGMATSALVFDAVTAAAFAQ